MAFTVVRLGETVFGDKVIRFGTFASSAGDTGGAINTGLKRLEYISLQPKGTAVQGTLHDTDKYYRQPVVNGELPLSGGEATIVTLPDQEGFWFAFGTL